MISELIDFGRWLDDNGQARVGDVIPEEAAIMIFKINKDMHNIVFDKTVKYNDYKNVMKDSDSKFERNLYILTGNSGLTNTDGIGGISPFFFKLSNSVFKEKKVKEGLSVEELRKKVKKSSEEGKKNYTLHLKYIIGNKDLLTRYGHPSDGIKVKNIVTKYFKLLENNLSNKKTIIDAFNQDFDTLLTSKGIYMYFQLEREFRWVNDLFLDYVKFYKKQKDKIEFIRGYCPFCKQKEKILVYKEFPFFALQKPNYNWNFVSEDLRGSKFKICDECNYFLQAGFDTLKKEFKGSYLLIPHPKTDTEPRYGEFLKEIRSNSSKFEKINSALRALYRDFNFDFVVYSSGKDNQLKRYISNYKAFLLEFKNIQLYDGNELRYLFGEHGKFQKRKSYVENTFDLEDILKEFFVDVQDEKLAFPRYNHLYDIYIKHLTGKTGIFYKFNSKTVSLFAKYMENLFTFVYELNTDSLNKEMLNEIVLNCLTILEKHNRRDTHPWDTFGEDIKKRLNYYFMLKKELIGDKMMDEKNIGELKQICNRYSGETEEKIGKEETTKILEIVKKDPAIKYYLIGQFIRLLESFKANEGKKADLFTSYMSNSNRNNVKSLFVTEILKKNNYYISRLNKKGKIIFNILESNPNLFSDESISYEDYILFMFAGYYTENILSSSYGKEKKSIRGV